MRWCSKCLLWVLSLALSWECTVKGPSLLQAARVHTCCRTQASSEPETTETTVDKELPLHSVDVVTHDADNECSQLLELVVHPQLWPTGAPCISAGHWLSWGSSAVPCASGWYLQRLRTTRPFGGRTCGSSMCGGGGSIGPPGRTPPPSPRTRPPKPYRDRSPGSPPPSLGRSSEPCPPNCKPNPPKMHANRHSSTPKNNNC